MVVQQKIVAEARTPDVDPDPTETRDWLQAFDAVTAHGGRDRATFLLERIEERAKELGVVS